MKKKFGKKLVLNKKTITNLEQKDMNDIRGGSWVYICSDSCSYVYFCCETDKAANAKAAC
jgi:natural product precursor